MHRPVPSPPPLLLPPGVFYTSVACVDERSRSRYSVAGKLQIVHMMSSPEAPERATNHPTFAALGVPAPLVAVLARDGKTEAFPIQQDTLPDTLRGRDVLGRGKTGSGKTLAFSLPLIARLGGELAGGSRRPGHPVALVLAPTRELATQIDSVIAPLAAAYSLRSTTIFGGVKQNRQVAALKSGVDIVVACPGRLEDLMKQGFVSLDAVEITVIDEADHMADLGFLPIVTRILQATPQGRQRMLFSATLDNGVDRLVKRFLSNPVLHSVDEANSPVSAMVHHVYQVRGVDEKKALVEALASGMGRRILFMRTKHTAKRLAQQLNSAGIPAVDLHGNLSQAARDRNLAAFDAGDVRVMVATDIAARGIDVPDVELVVHVDPPTEHKAYLHRSGRTARAGHAGEVVTVCLPEQRRDVADLMRKAKISVTPVTVTATSPEVVELIGEVAPKVAPKPVTGGDRGAGSRGGRSRGGSARGGRNGSRDGAQHSPRSSSRDSAGNGRGSDRDRGGERDRGRRNGARSGSQGSESQASGRQGSGRRSGGNRGKGGAAAFSSGSRVGQLAGVRGTSRRSGGRNR